MHLPGFQYQNWNSVGLAIFFLTFWVEGNAAFKLNFSTVQDNTLRCSVLLYNSHFLIAYMTFTSFLVLVLVLSEIALALSSTVEETLIYSSLLCHSLLPPVVHHPYCSYLLLFTYHIFTWRNIHYILFTKCKL